MIPQRLGITILVAAVLAGAPVAAGAQTLCDAGDASSCCCPEPGAGACEMACSDGSPAAPSAVAPSLARPPAPEVDVWWAAVTPHPSFDTPAADRPVQSVFLHAPSTKRYLRYRVFRL